MVPKLALQLLPDTKDMCNLTFEELPMHFVVLYTEDAKTHSSSLNEMIVTVRLMSRIKLMQKAIVEIGDAGHLPESEKIRNLVSF